jgi:hypothetical protein
VLVKVFVWFGTHRAMVSAAVLILAIPWFLLKLDPWALLFVWWLISLGVWRVEEPRSPWPIVGATLLGLSATFWVVRLVL